MRNDLFRLKSLLKNRDISAIVSDIDGVLTGGEIISGDESENAYRKFSVYDGLAMSSLREARIPVALISSSSNSYGIERLRSLGANPIVFGLQSSGHSKAEIFDEVLAELGYERGNCAYLGDDLPDLALLLDKSVGLTACPANAVRDARKAADLTLKSRGGEGFFREFAEAVIESRRYY